MRKLISYFSFTCLLICTMVTSAFSWPDGRREGLLIGMTYGLADVILDSDTKSSSGPGFLNGFNIGVGITDQFLIDFKYRFWISDNKDITYYTASFYGDLMYFPVKDNGFFVNGGTGRALIRPDISGEEAKYGMFFSGGIGYEITKWIFISADYSRSNFKDNINSDTLTFSVCLIGY